MPNILAAACFTSIHCFSWPSTVIVYDVILILSMKESKLTPEQEEEAREVFLLFDKDGDNTIHVDKLGTVLRALGLYPTEEELVKMKDEVKADGEWRETIFIILCTIDVENKLCQLWYWHPITI